MHQRRGPGVYTHGPYTPLHIEICLTLLFSFSWMLCRGKELARLYEQSRQRKKAHSLSEELTRKRKKEKRKNRGDNIQEGIASASSRRDQNWPESEPRSSVRTLRSDSKKEGMRGKAARQSFFFPPFFPSSFSIFSLLFSVTRASSFFFFSVFLRLSTGHYREKGTHEKTASPRKTRQKYIEDHSTIDR